MKIGVNFFGPKFRLYRDFDGTLDALKASGFASAEICVAFAGSGEPPKALNLHIPEQALREMSGGIWSVEDAAERLRKVRAHGLEVLSCHAMLGFETTAEALLSYLPKLLDFGSANNISYFVFSPMKTLSEIRPMLPAIRQVSDALSRAGITLLIHNHEMECMEEDGVTALDCLMEQCPDLGLELDVGWAQFAGADPVALMEKYHDRIPLLHFKDLRADASPTTRDRCFTAVGEGSIPLKEIMAAARHCAIVEHGLIIDQDDSLSDILEDLARGAENIRAAAQ